MNPDTLCYAWTSVTCDWLWPGLACPALPCHATLLQFYVQFIQWKEINGCFWKVVYSPYYRSAHNTYLCMYYACSVIFTNDKHVLRWGVLKVANVHWARTDLFQIVISSTTRMQMADYSLVVHIIAIALHKTHKLLITTNAPIFFI